MTIDFEALTQNIEQGLESVPAISGRPSTHSIIENLLFIKLMAETGLIKDPELSIQNRKAKLAAVLNSYRVDAQVVSSSVDAIQQVIDSAVKKTVGAANLSVKAAPVDFTELTIRVRKQMEAVPATGGRANIVPDTENLLAAKLLASQGLLENPEAVVDARIKKLAASFQSYQLPRYQIITSVDAIDAIINRAISKPVRQDSMNHLERAYRSAVGNDMAKSR